MGSKTSKNFKAAILTLSDKGSRGEREDRSGPLIAEMLRPEGYDVVESRLLPDERPLIEAWLIDIADGRKADIVFTTGGTGLAKRDVTPEATLAVAEKNVPGIAEAMRANALTITGRAMLSRAVSVIRGGTLIVNLPGSPKAVKENLEYILPQLEHALEIMRGEASECAAG